MKHLVKSIATVTTLGATAWLLLADSALTCPHEAQSGNFTVTGNCGPSGTLKLSSGKDDCGVQVSGAEALGLPKDGQFRYVGENSGHSLTRGGWSLRGPLSTLTGADAGTTGDGGTESAYVECVTRAEGSVLKMRCVETRLGAEEPADPFSQPALCEAVLTPQLPF